MAQPNLPVQTVSVTLHVPPMPLLVDDAFDAWSWCASDTLDWKRPRRELAREPPIDGSNPSGLVFVIHEGEGASFLPRELARLHAPGYGLGEEWALAPYGIDDATDLLYERGIRPREVFWLAADSLSALVWGLHDWVHFHNHGSFEQPAMTELQCDLVALAWLRANRDAVEASARDLARVASDLVELSRERFRREGIAPPCDLDAVFAAPYPAALATRRVSRA